MAEIPDFEQIARGMIGRPSHLPDDCVPDIAEQLRQVWNARGAADDKAVMLRTVELMGTSGGGIYAGHYSKTIKALDR